MLTIVEQEDGDSSEIVLTFVNYFTDILFRAVGRGNQNISSELVDLYSDTSFEYKIVYAVHQKPCKPWRRLNKKEKYYEGRWTTYYPCERQQCKEERSPPLFIKKWMRCLARRFVVTEKEHHVPSGAKKHIFKRRLINYRNRFYPLMLQNSEKQVKEISSQWVSVDWKERRECRVLLGVFSFFLNS